MPSPSTSPQPETPTPASASATDFSRFGDSPSASPQTNTLADVVLPRLSQYDSDLTVPVECLDQLAKALDLKTDLARVVLLIMLRNLKLLDQKQQAYGPRNLTKFGVVGIIIRMNDKAERLNTAVEALLSGRQPVLNDESIVDTLRDQINYGAIGVAINLGMWGREQPA